MNTELYTQLVQSGVDEELARQMASDGGSQGGSMPFDVIKLNYDKDDILIDLGVKKGEFITGYQIDKQTFDVKKEGKVFKQPMNVVLTAVTYQYSTYDPVKGGYKYVTPFFDNIYDSNKIVETKTGKTVKQLKSELEGTKDKLVFNAIFLLIVKEEEEYTPYLMYVRGTNWFVFNEQLKEKGFTIAGENYVKTAKMMKWKSKKVATKASPAWVIDIADVEQNTALADDKFKKVLGDSFKTFLEWKESSKEENSKPTKSAEKADNANTAEASSDVPDDIDESEIPF